MLRKDSEHVLPSFTPVSERPLSRVNTSCQNTLHFLLLGQKYLHSVWQIRSHFKPTRTPLFTYLWLPPVQLIVTRADVHMLGWRSFIHCDIECYWHYSDYLRQSEVSVHRQPPKSKTWEEFPSHSFGHWSSFPSFFRERDTIEYSWVPKRKAVDSASLQILTGSTHHSTADLGYYVSTKSGVSREDYGRGESPFSIIWPRERWAHPPPTP